jgi:hypothetical protein
MRPAMTDEEQMSALFPNNLTSLMDFVATMDDSICGFVANSGAATLRIRKLDGWEDMQCSWLFRAS